MKNPFRHHTQGDTLEPPHVPDTPAELLGGTDEHAPSEHPWRHMQQNVDPDCVRDPGSDLLASWALENAAAEEELSGTDDQGAPKA